MFMNHGRSTSSFGLLLLLTLLVSATNSAVAQSFVPDWISIDSSVKSGMYFTIHAQNSGNLSAVNSNAIVELMPILSLQERQERQAQQNIAGQASTNSIALNYPRGISADFPLYANVPSTEYSVPQQKPRNKTKPISSPPVDGTWREDGKYVIIKLDGRELRLAKTPVSSDPPPPRDERVNRESQLISEPRSTRASGGTVLGRLMNRGRPLTNCKVSLIPLQRTQGGYSIDKSGDPQQTQTDETGNYSFENVPRGPYKLFWLPRGQRSWIRRIEYRPDVTVRTGETSQVKEIRVALRTIN